MPQLESLCGAWRILHGAMKALCAATKTQCSQINKKMMKIKTNNIKYKIIKLLLLLVDMKILCCKINLNPNFKRQKNKDFKAEILFKAELLCLSKCPSYPILLNNMLVITIPLFHLSVWSANHCFSTIIEENLGLS